MWTKEDIRKLHELWTSKNLEEISNEMKLTRLQVSYMVSQMRKAGIDMPKKHSKGRVMNLLYEMAHELNEK